MAVRSSAGDRILIAVITILLPLDDQLPAVGGRSFLFLVFGAAAAWVVFRGLTRLSSVLAHPVFLASVGYWGVSFFLESLHRSPQYRDLLHTALMVFGGIVLAVLCRDRRALRTLFWSLSIAGVILSVFLFQSAYSVLDSAATADRLGAQLARAEIDAERTVQGDLNALACYAAVGAAMALHLALQRGALLRRAIFLGAFGFCVLGAFLPLSRSGIFVLAVSTLAVLHGHGGLRARNLVGLATLGAVLLFWVPDTAFGRLDVSADDGRATIYAGLFHSLREYAVAGVGAGQYWNGWAVSHGIATQYGAMGAHNAFLQSLVYWGFLGLLALCAVVFAAAWATPKADPDDDASIGARALAFAALAWLMVVHTVWDKQFSLVLAVLVSADLLLRPRITAIAEPRLQRPYLAVPAKLLRHHDSH